MFTGFHAVEGRGSNPKAQRFGLPEAVKMRAFGKWTFPTRSTTTSETFQLRYRPASKARKDQRPEMFKKQQVSKNRSLATDTYQGQPESHVPGSQGEDGFGSKNLYIRYISLSKHFCRGFSLFLKQQPPKHTGFANFQGLFLMFFDDLFIPMAY